MLVLGLVAVLQMGKLRDVERDVEINWMASIRQTALMNSDVLTLRLESLRAVTTEDAEVRQSTLSSFEKNRSKLTAALKDYQALIASDRERELYTSVVKVADAYSKQLDILDPLMKGHENAKAIDLINTGIRALTNQLQEEIGALAAFNDEGAAAAGRAASNIYSTGLWLVICLIAGAVLVTVGMSLLLIKSITTPIGQALLVAERIAGSDLSKSVVVSGSDEAGRLLKALAQMQENLRDTIVQITDSSSQLASAAEEMSAVTEESSKGMVSQNDEVNQAATAVTEMSAAVDEVARNAESASEESKRTQEFTQTGKDRVAQTLTSIQSLTGSVVSTSDQVVALSDRAQEISKVVEVIRAIAEQTNLLALNAAIEAARAGEQGRGFAVVADEVRALAHRTQQSTQEIEQMISAIQSDSRHAVEAMGLSKEQAMQSLVVAQEASASLDQIASAIVLINERNLLIATASEEQAHVAREVDRNLVSIRELSIQSAAGASQTASASNEMSNLAVAMKRLVDRFVV
ncbi:methyl-accepting chemotaxis protein [Pseudomonas fluorescens]|uniref:methyl-accepting chemotaxis protein n=1 Tax=Pseudomonas fluorescens TaxID=294 RepID=UPI0039783188